MILEIIYTKLLFILVLFYLWSHAKGGTNTERNHVRTRFSRYYKLFIAMSVKKQDPKPLITKARRRIRARSSIIKYRNYFGETPHIGDLRIYNKIIDDVK